jgi:NTP pyrophosphatase (non-canonical NTP hydrolase)
MTDLIHKNHVKVVSGFSIPTTENGDCVYCTISKLEKRVDELLEANTREIERRRKSEGWLQRIQEEHTKWSMDNFDEQDVFKMLAGVMEELGELAHALLKQSQGIRGSYQEHEEAGKDAVGDIVIFIIAVCMIKSWDLTTIIQDVWTKVVKKRNWKENKEDGLVLLNTEYRWQCQKCLSIRYTEPSSFAKEEICCNIGMFPALVEKREP